MKLVETLFSKFQVQRSDIAKTKASETETSCYNSRQNPSGRKTQKKNVPSISPCGMVEPAIGDSEYG